MKNNSPIKIALLGASGSIGTQTLDVIRQHSDKFELYAFSLGSRYDTALSIDAEFLPKYTVLTDESLRKKVSVSDFQSQVLFGDENNTIIASMENVDCVVIAMPGMNAIKPLLAANAKKKRLAVANKECLVSGGDFVRRELEKHGNAIYPIDSEQSAIFQCLQGINRDEISRLILTASGGPFRNYTLADMNNVTIDQALAHPKWSMGKKISIDSATLINKGLEVLEACYLFNLPASKVDVAIHPLSIVHSFVETIDGSLLAQMGVPDMRVPIQYALTHPARLGTNTAKLNLFEMGSLEFFPADLDRFVGLRLAYDAYYIGKSAPAIYNAADEVAVEAFLNGRIRFLDIAYCVEKTLETTIATTVNSLDEIFHVDALARLNAENIIKKLESRSL